MKKTKYWKCPVDYKCMWTKYFMQGIDIQKIQLCILEGVFSHVGCLSLSGFDEISEAVFEVGRSLIEKAEQERKRLQNVYILVGVDCWKSKCKRECVCCLWESKWREWECAVSANKNVNENEFLEDESIYRQSLSRGRLQMHRKKNWSCGRSCEY